MVMKPTYIAGSLVAVALTTGCSKAPTVSFASDVLPVLNTHCMECHKAGGTGTVESGFSVESYDSVMAGTKLGPMVVAGTAVVWAIATGLDADLATVGDVPSGLPSITTPPFEPGLWLQLATRESGDQNTEQMSSGLFRSTSP